LASFPNLLAVLAAMALCGCGPDPAPVKQDAARDLHSSEDGNSEVIDSIGPTGEAGGSDEMIDSVEPTGEAGTTMVGVYTCCAQGEGTDCCFGIARGLCFTYGGSAGRCLEEGEEFDAKDICAGCCAGLSKVHPGSLADGGTECQSTAPPSVFICVRCGDGVCGDFENRCSCPADCQ